MTEEVSNRGICYIEAVLLLCEHGHFLRRMAFFALPTYNIRVKNSLHMLTYVPVWTVHLKIASLKIIQVLHYLV